MFVFFDKNGVVREVINDKPVREGNVKANRIYCYFDEINPYDVFITIQWADLVKTNEISFIDNVVEMAVPYNKDRDYKFFKDFKKYKFYYFDIENVSSEGLANATVRIMEDNDSLFSQGIIAFYVENSVIKTDYQITQAQYDYLVSLVARNNLEIKAIRYSASVVYPTEINTVFEPYYNRDNILSEYAEPNFNIEGMWKWQDDDNVENVFYQCGINQLSNGLPLESAGFELKFNNKHIGKLQLQINTNKFGGELSLNCYTTIIDENGEEETIKDTKLIPPMETGVFAYFIFDIYQENVKSIKIVQEDGELKNRFSVKSIEVFEATGSGRYFIIQKNGVLSEIDNPDINWLNHIYDYVNEQMYYIREHIDTVQENADDVQEAFDYIRPAYEDIKAFENDLDVRQPQIEQDLTDAINTLTQINSQLNQPNGYATLGADGKLLPSQIPIEKVFDVFHIYGEEQLITLSLANVGDIAYELDKVDGKITIVKSYRLLEEPYSNRNNWVIQGTSYSSNSTYAERSGLADNSSAVNGIAFKKITLANYNKLTDKTGTYLVVME